MNQFLTLNPSETKEQQVAFLFTMSSGHKIQNITEPKCFPKLRR